MSSAPHTWPRLYIEEKLSTGACLTLDGDKSHYLINVLRLTPSDPLRLFNGQDGEWHAIVTEAGKTKKKGATLSLLAQLREQNEDPDLCLCCAPIKRAHFDTMIMKATELGARIIQPILTSRTQIRDINTDRLRAIAVEAAEQSERMTLPEIRAPLSLEKLIAHWPAKRLAILCAEFGESQPVARALSGALASSRKSVAIITGPEGGFTPAEMDAIKAMPEILPIRLGPRILRADTAALAAMSCWQALCGDWQSREPTTRPRGAE